MVELDDFRRLRNPDWDSVSLVRERKQAGRCIKQFADGSFLLNEGRHRTLSLPEGITVHETDSGLQINHANGYVARIERGELHIGDGLAFKYCGRLERLYSEDGVYVYESSNSRFRMDAGGVLMEQV